MVNISVAVALAATTGGAATATGDIVRTKDLAFMGPSFAVPEKGDVGACWAQEFTAVPAIAGSV